MPLLPGRVYTIGRSEQCDIVVSEASVSQRHATISADETLVVTDLGSRNGTRLGSVLLEPGRGARAPVGSTLVLGGVTILVQRSEEWTSDVWRCAAPLGSQLPSRSPSVRVRAQREATESFVTHEPEVLELLGFARRIASSDLSVLLLGETGVGKDLLARAIHESSPRASAPLVTLNCAAIPENLVESELFGHERGAFSGAVNAKRGLFEAAHGSTIFLDEVGELPLAVQPKLLRVLESGEVLRIGAIKPTRVDVRVVAATNRDLLRQIAAGGFRADLYYRLNGISISIPPLRERPKDIVPLARLFASALHPDPQFTDAALAALAAHPWPGNVRELRSVVERAALLARGAAVDARHLVLELPLEQEPESERDFADTQANFTPDEVPTGLVRAELDRRERRRIEEALERTGGNQKAAAELLGIARRTLMKRLDRYGILRPRKRRQDGET